MSGVETYRNHNFCFGLFSSERNGNTVSSNIDS